MKLILLVKKGILLALGAASLGCHAQLAAQQQSSLAESQPSYQLEREILNFAYTPSNWPQILHADLYLPQQRGLLPVVIVIHGGSWANRSRKDMTTISKELAQRGYAVMNLDYRFAPQFTFPAQLDDLQQARSWLAANADLYQLDLNRVNAWGYSSGAHLAALLGSLDNAISGGEQAQQLPRLRAVVAGGIPADLREYAESPIVARFMGGTRDEMPERYADASPFFHISADDPPVFLYHGKLDVLVDQNQSINYYNALRAAGVKSELYLHRWRGHATMFLFGGDAENRAIDFLNRNNI
jgi:acetyl esterase/lipase